MGFVFASPTGLLTAFASVGLRVQVLFWIAFAVFLGGLTGAIRYIRSSRVGVVEKLWSSRKTRLMARRGEV